VKLPNVNNVDCVSSERYVAVTGRVPEVLPQRRRRLRQQYLVLRPLAPARVGWLNDRNGAESVSSTFAGDRLLTPPSRLSARELCLYRVAQYTARHQT
jgi:hypothetical protein